MNKLIESLRRFRRLKRPASANASLQEAQRVRTAVFEKTTEDPEGAAKVKEPAISDLSDLPSVWDLGDGDLDWVVQDFIARQSVTLISSESGTGKTWLAYFIAGNVALGKDLLGRTVRQQKVLYVDGENPLSVARRNLSELGIEQTPELKIWGGWNNPAPQRPDHSLVRDFVRQHQGLVIYDSLVEFHPGDEQSSTESRRYMKHFRDLANLGGTVVVLHHTGKSEGARQYRGSSDIKAAVDTAYLLKTIREGDDGKLGELSLRCFKARLAPGLDIGLKFNEGEGFLPTDASSVQRNATPRANEVVRELVEEQPGQNQSTIVELARERSVPRNKAVDALKKGSFRTETGPYNAKLYYPHEEPAPTSQEEELPEVAEVTA